MEFSAEIIAAVGAAAVFAALTFRQLSGTVIKLNDELQEAIKERHDSEVERTTLKSRIVELESQLGSLKLQMETQAQEIANLRRQVQERDGLLASLQQRLESN